LPGLRL